MATKNWFSPRSLLVIAGIILLGLMVWRFSNIVAYILIASVLALITRPLVRLLGRIRIGKWRIPVSIRALITLMAIWAFFFGFFRIFIPLVANEAQELSSEQTATVIEEFEKPILRLENWISKLNLGGDEPFTMREALQQRLGSILSIKVITDLLTTVASILGNVAWAIFAISFITFFLLREDRLISEYIVTVFPKEKEDAFRHALESVKHLLRRYFVGILLQMTGILTLVTLGMTIVGVGFKHGLVIGLLAAVLNVIPYLGPWIGTALGITLGIATHLDLDFTTQLVPLIGYMLVVFIITQVTDNTVFQPLIFGTSVYAHPIEIFIVIMMAGSLAGIVGMILAIPTYTVIRVFAKEFFNNFRGGPEADGKDMTIKRIIAFICVCILVFPVLFGQNQVQLPDTAHLTVEQLQMFASMAIDTVDGELDVPNVFSPNGDEVNDYFEVTTNGTTAYEFSVFTRTGTRIYHSLSTRIFWDGKSIGGQDLPEGIYYYVIEEVGDSAPFTNAGFMHLFR